MSELILERYCYSETETEGNLFLDNDTRLYTLERPWLDDMPGGRSFESCIPDGEYELIPHTRPNGHDVYALRNPELHVYYTAEERGEQPGRYLILLHAGNYTNDVVGCIAPGMSRTIFRNQRMVTSSRPAMGMIMATEYESIRIVPVLGTEED